MPVTPRAVRAAAAFTLSAVLLLASWAAPPAATAAPGSPTGLSPDATSIAGLPILEWNRVRSALRYEVEVSTSDSFGSTVWKTSTTNRRATPTVQLPGGQIHWRVRAVGATGASAWREAQFSRDALAGPAPLGPADDAVLQQPEEPALISWSPVRGAISYTVQVGTDEQFVDSSQFKAYTTKTSSHVVPDPLVATVYYWRVRADLGSGVVTDWSLVRSYSLSGLAKPVLDSPADSPTTSVIDVVLDWHPVVGAKTYNLQISTDQNFNTIEHQRNGIQGTRYSPPVNLDNDQYYWRVSPVDSAGNTLDWTAVDFWTFRRHWPDQPHLEYPADQTTVGDPFFYQWTPVPHASSYRVELSLSPSFGSLVDSCTTVHTTYIPANRDDCYPTAVGTYYWRVLAFDAPHNPPIVTDGIAAEVHRFTYEPDLVQLTSPANGASVELPILRWNPVAGAAEYQVTLTQVDTGAVISGRTTGTSWTPRNKLAVNKTYRWQVQAVSASGRMGAGFLPGSQPTFTVVESTAIPADTPEPVSPAGTSASRFPTLQWTPVSGATSYQMYVRRQGTSGWLSVPDRFVYPAGEDDGSSWLDPDTYEWRIEAYNGNTLLSESSAPSTFVVRPLQKAIGQGAAMSGTASLSGETRCTKSLNPSLPLTEQQCVDLHATPVLSWDAHPDAGSYVVWISRDQQMTNLVGKYPTDQTMFIPTTALIDSQAGSAFYWWIQPCKRTGMCLAQDYAAHAFNKLSKPVELVTPAANSAVANDVTFVWRDYLATNQDTSTIGDHAGVYSVEPDVEAHTYRLQVDNDPNFQSPLETVVVDQTTYTAYGSTYPEGPLYWRVQAIDGSNNSLTWSEPRMFEKRSPTVTLTEPTDNIVTSGSAPLRWAPLAYAASYDVEVYKNGDTIGQDANRMWSGNSRQVAWASAQPLPPSNQPYTWRVRPRDASNRPGQWTDLADPAARFRVSSSAPTLTSPAPGIRLDGDDVLFTWDGVDGASAYRFERRLDGASGNAETVKTPGLAWAPASTIGDGRWEWRVVSVNSAGADMAASPWSTFTVDDTAPSVIGYKPNGYAKPKSNFVATFSEPVKGVSKRTVKLYVQKQKKPLRAKVTVNRAGTKATLNPIAKLRRGKSYRVVLTSGIRDSAGNKLAKFTWSATVG